MRPIRKLVRGGGHWLPFALKKLRELVEQAGGMRAWRRFRMPDGALVQVKVTGEEQSLHIKGKPVTYEFFTSEHVNRETLASPGYEGTPTGSLVTDIGRRVQGSFTRATGPNRAKPVYSQVFEPEGTEWRYQTLPDYVETAFIGDKRYPISWGAWQSQKFFEYVNWLGNSGASMTTSTQAQAPGMNSQCAWASAYYSPRVANTDAYVADYGPDVPPTHYMRKGQTWAGGPEYATNYIWWRRGAVQIAGGRKFFICTDSIGRFQVYPLKAYQSMVGVNYRAISDANYKEYVPEYPGWVTVPNPGNELRAYTCHWLWAFNKDATKAVSCPFNSTYDSELLRNSVLATPNVKEATKLAAAYAAATTPENIAFFDPAGWIPTREDKPGLVELAIEIVVTGVGDMAFDVVFTVLRTNYSADTGGRYIFDAAYSLPDKGRNKLMGVPEDTLLTAEIECYTTTGGYSAGPLHLSNPTLPNPSPEVIQAALFVDGFMVINANDVDMVPTEILRRVTSGQVGKSRGTSFLTALGIRQTNTTGYDGWELNASLWLTDMNPPRQYNLNDEIGAAGNGNITGFLYALELRTLSMVYTTQDTKAGTVTYDLLVYNDPEYSGGTQPFGSPQGGVYPACTQKIPASANHIHAKQLNITLDTKWGQGFSIHPEGHWALTMADGSGLDAVKFKGRALTTHKALFNKAFGQERDYSFYATDYPGKYTPFFGDIGSFRTNGVFMTF